MDLEWAKLLFTCLFDRRIRMRLCGYRPEIICLVRAAHNNDRYLLIVPEANHTIWIPPQEGIGVEDTLQDAVQRCLQMELGFQEAQIQFRRSCWLAKRVLPRNRWDERDLAYSLRKLTGASKMVGKAYWGALIIADDSGCLSPNRAEVFDYAWVSSGEFQERIGSNVQDKLTIIQSAWERLIDPAGSGRDADSHAGTLT